MRRLTSGSWIEQQEGACCGLRVDALRENPLAASTLQQLDHGDGLRNLRKLAA